MQKQLTDEQRARVHVLLETIAIDPQAFRFALGLETDEDIQEEARKLEEFRTWRTNAVSRLRKEGKL